MPKDVTKQKEEMTIEEFVEYYGEMIINHGNKMELRADLRSVIRGKLVEYTDWLEIIKLNDEEGTSSEIIVDDFLKDNQ